MLVYIRVMTAVEFLGEQYEILQNIANTDFSHFEKSV